MRVTAIVFWLVLSTSCAFAQRSYVLPLEVRSKPDPTKPTVCDGRGSVVVVDLPTEQTGGLVLLTAAHVVAKSVVTPEKGPNTYTSYPTTTTFEVYINGVWSQTDFKCFSKDGDLALLTMPYSGEYPKVKHHSTSVEVGDALRIRGYVLGLSHSDYLGELTEVDLGNNFNSLILKDAAVIPGMSGGAVIDSNGRLAGIITGYPGETPWVVYHTRPEEISRFLTAAWDDKWPIRPKLPPIPQEGRAHPRTVLHTPVDVIAEALSVPQEATKP